MQVPEKLALIGGSILLTSTLIFTLKSQASQILPKVLQGSDAIYQSLTDTQAQHGALSFDEGYQRAQKNGWRTGTWGTAKYYVDGHMNMFIGSGELSGHLYDVLGSDTAHRIVSLNFQGDVRAPSDSSYLFSGARDRYNDTNTSITAINGLNRLDTSQVTDMTSMFANDKKLKSLDLSNWDTSQVGSLYTTFNDDENLQNLNVSHWDTSKIYSIEWAFFNDSSLMNLDLHDWHLDVRSLDHAFSGMSNLRSLDISNFSNFQSNMSYMFGGDWTKSANKLSCLVIGGKTRLNHANGLPNATWKDGNKTTYTAVLNDAGLHPGTWIRR